MDRPKSKNLLIKTYAPLKTLKVQDDITSKLLQKEL